MLVTQALSKIRKITFGYIHLYKEKDNCFVKRIILVIFGVFWRMYA